MSCIQGKDHQASCLTAKSVFVLDSADARSLSEQLADNIARAVLNGTLLPGDKLPSLKAMAGYCGTSLRVPVDAIAKLREQGVVKGRPRSGIEILAKGRLVYRGHVVLIQDGDYVTYYREALYHALSVELASLGWFAEYVTVPSGKPYAKGRYLHLEDALARRPSLAFGLYCASDIISVVERSQVPFAILSSLNKPVDGSVGTVSFCTSRALDDLAEACRAKGVRHLLLVASGEDDFRFSDIFSSRGIRTERLDVDPIMLSRGTDRLECCRLESGRLLSARLSNRSLPRPDLVYFADDHFAESGLWAMTTLGLRIPEDVRVVTFANRGNVPVFRKALARVEEDLGADASQLARAIVGFLKTGTFKTTLLSSARFVPGETF